MTAVAFGCYCLLVAVFALLVIRRVPWPHLLLLAALVIIFWGRMLPMFTGDDDLDFLMLYPPTYSLASIFSPSCYYQEFRPLLHFHNYLLWSIFGREWYIGFKVVTLLFHFINTLLAYRFIRLFVASEKTSLLAAAIYAVHPAPAWEIMQIAPSYMVTFFFFTSFLCYVHTLKSGPHSRLWLFVSLLSLVLGLSYKASLLGLLLAIPAYVFFFQPPSRYWKEVAKFTPFVLIGFTFLFVKLSLEKNFAKFEEDEFRFGIHVFTQLWDYFTLMLFPRVLSIPQEIWLNITTFDGYRYYPIRYPFSLLPLENLHILFRLLTLGFLIFFAIKSTREDRFLLVWCVVTLAIYLGLVNELATHYTRLAVAAIAILLVHFYQRLANAIQLLKKPAIQIAVTIMLFFFYWVQIYRVGNIYYIDGVVTAAVSEGREDEYDFSKITDLKAVQELEEKLRPRFLEFINTDAKNRKYIGPMLYD